MSRQPPVPEFSHVAARCHAGGVDSGIGRSSPASQDLPSEFLAAALEASLSSICITDTRLPDNPIVYCNPAFERLTGYSREEVLGQNCRILQHDDRDQVSIAIIRAAVNAGEACRVELRNYRKDGTLFWNELYVAPIFDSCGHMVAFVGVQNDITERMELARLRGEQYFKALVAHISDVIAVVAPNGVVQYVSDAILPILGCAPAMIVGTSMFDRIPADDAQRARDALADCVRHAGRPTVADVRWRHADGSWRDFDIVASNRLDDPWVHGIVLNCRDVTERRLYLEQLRHQALHDGLTGLPNRALLEDRLQQAMTRAREDGSPLALLWVDLDHFKDINEALGHHVGDRLLAVLSGRLRKIARPGDSVARLGGDEFALVTPGALGDAAELARAVQAAVAEPVLLDGNDVHVGASIGVALFPEHGDDVAGLMSHAVAAMYTAKRLGSGYSLYSPEDGLQSMGRLTLMSDLRQSIPRGDLVLHFQPKVDLRTASVVSVEALVRWHHPTRGLLYPDAFISLAEETGMIEQLTLAVLDAALCESARWQQYGCGITFAVNVSARSLHHPDFAEQILAGIQRHGVPGASLILEVTESTIMENLALVLQRLNAIRAAGVRISIDDFGTGYSSLAQLKRLPVEEIKIDKSFILGMAGSTKDTAIVQAVIELGHSFGLTVVAEGVEHEAILDSLRRMGCDVAQGYFLARPMPVDLLHAWLETSPYGLRAPCRPPLTRAIVR